MRALPVQINGAFLILLLRDLFVSKRGPFSVCHRFSFPPLWLNYRRIYPPDDKLLLEKYEGLLAAAFQTFLSGRAASLQREMNNPLKRMKVLMSGSVDTLLAFLPVWDTV